MNRRWVGTLAMILAACLASKLSLWEFRNKSYRAKIISELPLFWSLGSPQDPVLEDLGKRIDARLAEAKAGMPADESVRTPGKENVLMLLVESLRADAIDSEVAPFLDSLGRTGLLFKNHFSSANYTPYAVFSLLTGKWPSEYRSFLEAGGKPMCYGMFPGSAFITGNAKSWSLWDQDRTLFSGFQTLDCRYPGDAETSDSGMIENFFGRIGRSPAVPFFGVLMFNATHFRYEVDPGRIIRPDYRKNADDIRRPEALDMPAIKDRYLNSVHFVDAMLRRTFRKLDSLGLSRSTVVVVVGDHGEEFMETGKFTHASEVNRYQTHVPLIIKYRDWRREFTGYSSHVQLNFILGRLLSGGNPEDILQGIEKSFPPAALAFNAVALPDNADEFGVIGNDFELRMRWCGARLKAYDARFTGTLKTLGPERENAISETIRWAGKHGIRTND